jgi:elongation factor Ts
MDAVIANNVNSVEELNAVKIGNETVADKMNEQVAKIGEKISVSRFERVEAPYVAAYIHGSYRMGVLVGFNKSNDEAGKDVAMQIAAMNPIAIDQSSVPAETIERERAIAIEQIKAEGKPAEMAEKIAVGKVNKFFKESTLLAQPFVKDANKSVEDYLKGLDADLKVVAFKRVALG